MKLWCGCFFCQHEIMMLMMTCLWYCWVFYRWFASSLLVVFHKSLILFPVLHCIYLGGHCHGSSSTSVDLEIATHSHYDLLGSILGRYENFIYENFIYQKLHLLFIYFK